MTPDATDATLTTLLVPFLFLLGQLWKRMGLWPELVTVVNTLIAVILCVGYTALVKWPDVNGNTWGIAAIAGATAGIAASKLYDASKGGVAAANSRRTRVR
jgi:uncharacterized membrane protein